MRKTHVFAALTIGSYEVTLTIYEVSPQSGMRLLNKVKQKIELGKDTLRIGRISNEKVKQLCKKLLKLKPVMEEFGVEDILAYGATALREAENRLFVLEQIKTVTGFDVKILNNAQQSFLVYKGVVSNPAFDEIAKDGVAILDASPGKLRVTIYHDGTLALTQNISLGSMQLREWVKETGYSQEDQTFLIRELISYRFKELDSLFLDNVKIKTLILSGDLFTSQPRWKSKKGDILNTDKFLKLCRKGEKHLEQNMALTEDADILLPSVIICEEFYKRIGAKQAWISGIEMNDGIAYEHAMATKYLPQHHDFMKDIYSEVEKVMMRFIGETDHNYYVGKVCDIIFQSVAKKAGLTTRDRILLQTAALLHNVGTYVTMTDSADISSYLVKKMDLVGFSDRDLAILAEIIRCHKMSYEDFIDTIMEQHFSSAEMNRIGKLSIILGVANTLDVAHCQKFDMIRVNIKGDELRITVNSLSDGVLEKNFLEARKEYFEAMFGYQLVLREKNQRYVTL